MLGVVDELVVDFNAAVIELVFNSLSLPTPSTKPLGVVNELTFDSFSSHS